VCRDRRRALAEPAGLIAAGWFVVGVVRWIAVVVVLASAGNSLFRGCAAAGTQEVGVAGRQEGSCG
jgi:hypothetical protein